MSKIDSFPEGTIESLAKVLGECGTGSDITRVLQDRNLEDRSGESTKWRRLYWIFLQSQKQYGCANRILDFIQSFLKPARFVRRTDEFEEHRQALNLIFVLHGLEYGDDGKFHPCDVARTLNEAEARVRTIRAKLQGRRIHDEVLKYCRAELMQDNYFHAVFEATKGLAQRIRDLSGVDGDGTALVDRVFATNRPILAFNTLQTETEMSEHKGVANLLKGCFTAIRNPRAHEPRILWKDEDDAADYFTMVSLLHRKLDDCVQTGISVSS